MRLRGESPGRAAEKRPEGERREARGQVGMLVTYHVRVRPLWASDLRGLVVKGCVHALQCPRTCGTLRVHGHTRGARGGSFMFHGGTTPLSPAKDPLHRPPRPPPDLEARDG